MLGTEEIMIKTCIPPLKLTQSKGGDRWVPKLKDCAVFTIMEV